VSGSRALQRLCVFCGSSKGTNPAYLADAQEVGRTLAQSGLGLVYGGGNIGLMGALADAALAAGGHVIGVIPEALLAKEVGHRGLPDLRVVKTMHERKALMAELSDGFIALPGGFGTFEEFFEVLTWSQLGLHPKPCGLLNVAGFFDPLLELLNHSVTEGFVRPAHRALVIVDADIRRLLAGMTAFQPPPVHKWIDRDEV
jgi:uncharacterized protein (TIGR00730 family)